MWQDKLVDSWYRGARWLWLLIPLSLLFRAVAALRRTAYSVGLFSSWRAPVPVVVVGNITVGGTGKTPVIIALVEHLQAQGLRVGVISRGYGATAQQWPHVVTTASTADQCGDEPLLIFQRTGCCCVAGPDRRADIEAAISEASVDIVLCDDGLQHYALARDYEIAVLDAQRGVGNGWCLPAGPLREPPSRLQQVDAVLYRGLDDPKRGVNYEWRQLVNLKTGQTIEAGALDKNVYALAGIGQPAQFFATLESLGYQLSPRVFADHYQYRAQDLGALLDKPVIMTEKDAVKCRHFATESMWYLPIKARLPDLLMSQVMRLSTKEQR